jgi:hypothetical protein
VSGHEEVARAKLAKAEEFLMVAGVAETDAPSATVSLAITAGILASDVILLRATRTAPTGAASHEEAVGLLRGAGYASASSQLQRLVAGKTPIQYRARAATAAEAADAIKRATRLVDAARAMKGSD